GCARRIECCAKFARPQGFRIRTSRFWPDLFDKNGTSIMASGEALQPERSAPRVLDDDAEATTDRALTAGRPALLRVALSAAGIGLATRSAYVLFSYFAGVLDHAGPSDAWTLVRAWDQFDTHFYLLISRHGYFWVPTAAGRVQAVV